MTEKNNEEKKIKKVKKVEPIKSAELPEEKEINSIKKIEKKEQDNKEEKEVEEVATAKDLNDTITEEKIEKISNIEEDNDKKSTSNEDDTDDIVNYSYIDYQKAKKIEKKTARTSNALKNILLTIFAFVVGGICMLGIIKWTPLVDELLGNNKTIVTKNGTQVYEKSSLATSVEKAYNSVVMISGYKNDTLASTGTGFVYKTDEKYGYLLTNQHVVSGCSRIKLTLSNDEEVDATVLGGDEYLDLAVLRIDKDKVLDVATIGTSENMKLGDTIFTIGSPMGENYRGSVTSGILSGKDRMVAVSVSKTTSTDWIMRVIQIDASINPGNSGGPLLNVNGEVIGVCSMKLVDDEIEGMGFAIPIEYAMNHVDSLEKGEKIQWPMLGISMANTTDVSSLYRNGITIDKNIKEGVVIVKITEDTGAAKSDLKEGDIITKLNGHKVKDSAYLRYELYQHQAGDVIEVTYIRDGREQTTKVTLSKNTE